MVDGVELLVVLAVLEVAEVKEVVVKQTGWLGEFRKVIYQSLENWNIEKTTVPRI